MNAQHYFLWGRVENIVNMLLVGILTQFSDFFSIQKGDVSSSL